MANQVVWNWRVFFQCDDLNTAERNINKKDVVTGFEVMDDGSINAEVGLTSSRFHTRISGLPTSYSSCVKINSMEPEQRDISKWICGCSKRMKGKTCVHLALLALYYEKIHGALTFTETAEEAEARIAEEKRKKEKEREQKRRDGLLEEVMPVSNVLPNLPDSKYFFDMKNILGECKTNALEVERLEGYRSKESDFRFYTGFTRTGVQCLSVLGEVGGMKLDATLPRKDRPEIRCSCGLYCRQSYYFSSYRYDKIDGMSYLKTISGDLCGHKLLLLEKAGEYVQEYDPGDETDMTGMNFMKNVIEKKHSEEKSKQQEPIVHVRDIYLRPYIDTSSNGTIMLGFMIGRDRDYVVKNIQNLVKAWMKKTEISYGKMSCNFAESDFDEDSMPWINLLAKQDDLHRDIEGSGTYGFATSSSQYRNETVELKGRLLDDFYLIAKEKGSISYCHKRTREAYPIYVKPARCKTDLQIVTLYRNDKLTGINVSGKIPSFLKGAVHNYQIADHVLSMIDAEDEKSLSSFKSIANSQGEFSFNVGLKSLQEFYYRVLPSLMANDCVVVDDKASKQIQEYLPPEPEFVFYCDLADGCLTMQIEVSYGDTKMILPDDSKIDGVQRDYQQEDRVMTLASKFFTVRKGKEYHTPLQYDEVIYRFLSEYITELSYYGEVQGSQAFNSLQIKPIPQFTMDVSLSLDSDLLDLEILTKDMSPEELLELLDSYHAKKKYHRLKSGDFIDLNDPDNMIMKMDETLKQLNLTIEDIVKGKGHLPLYRALYVNSLLEERQELVTKRDKTLSQLVRSFKTIKDSDFNVPASLENVIRPYQEIGCRWLNFLNQTGFGGILADEMGLGKTLQLLATLETRKNEGNLSGVSLVVCPASLVYNWLEEAKHFTPDLNVMAIAGTAAERKGLIESMDQGQADIYVTSYDLLKRDITMYDKITFDTIALDEAQYIKNQKTAVTKAIKVLKARHRIALTGTPIENRLSEMWSIFDFLMPGFLYSHDMFVKMFENPIVKQKNQTVSQQLQKMTSPFILRREKKEVLKELPEKMEEVRYSRMEEEQRKLYDAQVVNIKTQLLNGVENRDKIKIFAELTKLREICCDPSLLFDNYTGGSTKREAFIELVKNAIDGNHRMLVFSQFTSMLAFLEEDLKKEKINYYKITGSTAKEDRLRLVNKFNEGDVPVFLISLKAGGTGLNLTGADIVIHYDPWWNVAATNQATDRAHRIGQTKQVTVYKMIAKDTIEEKILDMQMMKKELADVFVNGAGESLTRMSAEELIALLS